MHSQWAARRLLMKLYSASKTIAPTTEATA
jgi:hypothetical protein